MPRQKLLHLDNDTDARPGEKRCEDNSLQRPPKNDLRLAIFRSWKSAQVERTFKNEPFRAKKEDACWSHRVMQSDKCLLEQQPNAESRWSFSTFDLGAVMFRLSVRTPQRDSSPASGFCASMKGWCKRRDRKCERVAFAPSHLITSSHLTTLSSRRIV